MPYLLIEDFTGGLDRRKSDVTTRPGALMELQNAFINPGGEIEKRKTFTQVANVPGDSYGLGFVDNTAYVFGTAAGPSVAMEAYTAYQQLIVSDTPSAIAEVRDVSRYANLLYVVAEMADGTIRHFFNGAEIPSLRNEGTNVRPHNSKMYAADGPNLRFSAIGNPADTVGTGSGIIDITEQALGSTEIVGIEEYYSFLALFGQTSVQVWAMDPDPVNNAKQQVLANIGLIGPHAVAQYGSGDVLFLSHTGVRSLRARDSSNAASVNDVGSPIDEIVSDRRATLTPEEARRIRALVDPLTGRFWLFWGTTAYVLSAYPSGSISAWAEFKLPYDFDSVVLANSRLLCRAGGELFVYGTVPTTGSPYDVNAPIGTDPTEYDNSEVIVRTPFLSAGAPATVKEWQTIDLACEGEWEVHVNSDIRADPDDDASWEKIAIVTGNSYEDHKIAIRMRSTHISVKLVNTRAAPAKMSTIGVHYSMGEAS